MCFTKHQKEDSSARQCFSSDEEIAVDYRTICACFAVLLILGLGTADVSQASNPYPVPKDLNVGPFVDSLEYQVIADQDQRILALQAGKIEMDTGFFNPVHLPTLSCADPDIDIFSAARNGYGQITINCAKYPLNISGFRRAFAFAFDKTRVTVEIMDGFSQEQDSLVPYVSGWCIEDDLPYHYYVGQPDVGNHILDNLGFEVDPESGWRNAPDGSEFHVYIEYSAASPEIAGGVAQIATDALHSMHVSAEPSPMDFNDYISRLASTCDYDMVFSTTDFGTTDVQWLAYEFWSGNVGVPYQNPCNFANFTYDAWREELLHGTTFEEVYEAASWMQMILHENVPRLVVYENTHMQGYRNDLYTGHVRDLCRYIAGPWTMIKIHKIDGSGGSVPIAIAQEPDSFNIFMTENRYSAFILDDLYSSLFRLDPNQHPVMDLATSLTTETHEDNPLVQAGHVRFTMEIVRNATWSDGTLLTAEDVAFTYSYLLESARFGNPAGILLEDLQTSVAVNRYKVRLEFSTESYWHFDNFAFVKIIPKHIFNDIDGFGYDMWDVWNPVFDPDEPCVTCGPYVFDSFEPGESYTVRANPLYHYYALPAGTGFTDSEIELELGALGSTIVWTPRPGFPTSGQYTLYEGDVILQQGSWAGECLEIDISQLPEGEHLLRLNVTYDNGYEETAEITVRVTYTPLKQMSLIGGSILPLAISVVSVQVIIGVALLSFRDYRRWKWREQEAIQEAERDWFREVFGG
jgi:ABC-type transport system substrate-binding protein